MPAKIASPPSLTSLPRPLTIVALLSRYAITRTGTLSLKRCHRRCEAYWCVLCCPMSVAIASWYSLCAVQQRLHKSHAIALPANALENSACPHQHAGHIVVLWRIADEGIQVNHDVA